MDLLTYKDVFIDIEPSYYFNKKDNIHRSKDEEIRWPDEY